MPTPTATYVVDERFVRLARAAVLRHFRPRRFLLLGSVLLVFVGLWAQDGADGFFTAAIAWLLVLALATVIWRRSTRRAIIGPTPVGCTIAARLEDDGLWLATPLSTSVTAYRAYRSAELDGDVVVLVRRHGRAVQVFPRELLPGTALPELSARIAQAARPGAADLHAPVLP